MNLPLEIMATGTGILNLQVTTTYCCHRLTHMRFQISSRGCTNGMESGQREPEAPKV